MRRRSFLRAAAGLAALARPARAEAKPEKLVFVTDWKAQAEHGGFYQALAAGFYRARGLDVQIRQGGPQINTQQIIASGAVDLAMGSNSIMLFNLVNAGVPVKAVMAAFQKDPQVFISHPRGDVSRLADMRGRPIMVGADTISTSWIWLKAKFGFTDTQIRPYTFTLAPFLADKTAIQQGYLGSEPFSIKRAAGIEPEVYLLADDGYPGYACMVVASHRLIDRKPQVAKAFVEASIEGWASYLNGDPAPGNALIRKDNPEMTDDLLAFGIAQMKKYGIVESGDAGRLGIGAMTEARWKEAFDVMASTGLYPARMDWRKAFMFDFVNKGHGLGK
ncbi:MAG TPA: ABC transporter substrate-binding protein [Azospirillaceae bacterium]|nr:ABC transporter substrate-binding protein [Azospirillaceae bacterium]